MMPDVYLDKDSALARVRGNEGLYKKMLTMFLKSAETLALNEALGLGDYDKAADLAHAVKGISGNLSLNVLFEASSLLMQELRTGKPADDTIEAYKDALEKTTEIVKSFVG